MYVLILIHLGSEAYGYKFKKYIDKHTEIFKVLL